MDKQTDKLLAGADQLAAATSDMIQAVREGKIPPYDNVGSGDTLTLAADGLRLLIEAMDTNDSDTNQLHGAAVRFLENRHD